LRTFFERFFIDLHRVYFNIERIEIVYALLLTLLFWLCLRLIRSGSLYLKHFLETNRDKIQKPLAYKNYTFIKAQSVEQASRKAAGLAVTLAYIMVVYAYLSIFFGFFAETKGIADILLRFLIGITSPLWLSFVEYLPNLLSIAVICVTGHYFLKLIKAFFKAIDEGKLLFEGFYREWAKPTYNIFKFLTILFILILIFPLFPGFNSPSFKGISVFIGVLLSLGSTSAVANVIAGIVLIYTRAFQIGDRIETNGVVGDVVDKALLVTQIRTIKNVVVTVPNALVLSTMTQNYSQEARKEGLILNTTVTIGYDVPWQQVHGLLIHAAQNTQDILIQPEPFILQKSLDDFFVSYELNAYTKEANRMATIYSALHQNIQDSFNQAGVEILSPHYRALRDGNQSTVVSNS
jgi:small-conductance mechanosensitive channel